MIDIEMKSLDAWLHYIESLHPKNIELGLERVQAVAAALDIISFSCPVITVAGTNGKGSCVTFLAEILQQAGYKVGAYTSPHLLKFQERIRIAGLDVTEHALVAAFAQIEQARQDIQLTYFEFTTLAALLLFKTAGLDAIILEVGLGGRLDAVNIVDPDIAIISSIAMDHMDWLGNSREEIGREKAGIFRKNIPVICGDVAPPNSILASARAIGAQLYCINREFHYYTSTNSHSWDWYQRSPLNSRDEGLSGGRTAILPPDSKQNYVLRSDYYQEGAHGDFRRGLLDWYSQKVVYLGLPLPKLPLQNAATALMAIQCLQHKLKVDRKAVELGLIKAFIPGRFQQFNQPVTTILDVAHNPAAATLLAQRLHEQPCSGKTLAVVSILSDKDIPATLRPLLNSVDQWYVGGLDVARGASAETMANHLLNLGVTAHTVSSVTAAFEQAVANCGAQDRILVFGSFYTVGLVLEHFFPLSWQGP